VEKRVKGNTGKASKHTCICEQPYSQQNGKRNNAVSGKQWNMHVKRELENPVEKHE